MDAKFKKEVYKQHLKYLQSKEPRPKDPTVPTSILRQDPMSPYQNPVSQMIFSSIAEEINKRSFKAVYPLSYTPISPYFTENGITPYYNPGEDIDYAHGAITIAGMIDLVNSNRPWALENTEDFDIVINIVIRYRDLLSAHANNKDQKSYLIKVNKFLAVMEKGRLRAYRRIGKMDTLRSKDIKYFFKDLVVE